MKKLTALITMLLTVSFAWAEGTSSSRATKALNPQPLPPGIKVQLNPQPLPPRVNSNAISKVAVNPQPLPPGAKVGFNPQPDPPAVQKHMGSSSPKLF